MHLRFLLVVTALQTLGFAAMAQAISPLVQKPIDEFELYKAAILKDVEVKVAAKREAVIRDLEGRIAGETRTGNLNGALAIKAKVDELKRESGSASGRSGSAKADTAGHLGWLDFERKLEGWTKITAATTATPQAAHSGKMGLHYEDAVGVKNSAFSAKYPAPGEKECSVRFWARGVKGEVRVGMQCYNAAGASIGVPGAISVLPAADNEWKELTISGVTPVGTTQIDVWLTSKPGIPGTADFDDFVMDVDK